MADDRRRDELAALPAYAEGGRVDRTGIALVHEGEHITPAPGSEAVVSPLSGEAGDRVVNWHFPVEIEVVGQLSEDQRRAVAGHVYAELRDALDGRM